MYHPRLEDFKYVFTGLLFLRVLSCCNNTPSSSLSCSNTPKLLPWMEIQYTKEYEKRKFDKPRVQKRVYKKVIGVDERVLVRENDLQLFPWSSIGLLQVGKCPGSKETYTCTATIIAPNVAITAAHCVTRKSEFCKSLVFSPGSSGTSGTVGGRHGVVRVEVLDCWSSGDVNCDFALLFLRRRVGCSTGIFQYDGECEDQILPQVYVAGYPIDKFYGMRMYFAACKNVKLPWCIDGLGSFNHQCDTERGMSGAPLWTWKSGQRYLKGIHRSARKSDTNSATRITTKVITWINSQIAGIQPCY